MKYQVGNVGKVIVVRFEDGDEILGGLADIARVEQIRAGIFYLVGGIKEGKIVVGPVQDVMPPTAFWSGINESHESVGIGTIFWYKDEPRVHFHGAYGKHEKVKVGCLREFAETFLVMEGFILEIVGVKAVRELDPLSNMILLKLNDDKS